MNLFNFNKNKRIIATHFRLNWKLLLFFSLVFLLFTIFGLLFGSDGSDIRFRPCQKVEISTNAPVNNTREHYYEIDGIYSTLFSSSFGAVGVLMLSIYTIVIVKICIISEVKDGNIVYWMTTSNSRMQLILSKLAYIWLFICSIFAPAFLFTIFYSLQASDISLYIGYIVLRGLYFLIFMLLIAAVYSLIATVFINNGPIYLSICMFLTAYVYVIPIVQVFLPNQSNFINYISPINLLAYPIKFDEDQYELPPVTHGNEYFQNAVEIKVSVAWNVASVFINIIAASSASIGTMFIYKEIDFNI